MLHEVQLNPPILNSIRIKALSHTRQSLNRMSFKMEDLAFGNGQDPLVIFTSGLTPLPKATHPYYLESLQVAVVSDRGNYRVRPEAERDSLPTAGRLPTLTEPGNIVYFS